MFYYTFVRIGFYTFFNTQRCQLLLNVFCVMFFRSFNVAVLLLFSLCLQCRSFYCVSLRAAFMWCRSKESVWNHNEDGKLWQKMWLKDSKCRCFVLVSAETLPVLCRQKFRAVQLMEIAIPCLFVFLILSYRRALAVVFVNYRLAYWQ